MSSASTCNQSGAKKSSRGTKKRKEPSNDDTNAEISHEEPSSMMKQDERVDVDTVPPIGATLVAVSHSHSHAPPEFDADFVQQRKRARKSFTELAQADIVTLPLVFSFLDIHSILKARRVCPVWQRASRTRLCWAHTVFSCNIEFLLELPLSSFKMLRHLCLVRDLKAKMPDLREIFKRLSELPMLASLRLEELKLDAGLCDLLATYLPTLRALDGKMSMEYETAEVRAKDTVVHSDNEMSDDEENFNSGFLAGEQVQSSSSSSSISITQIESDVTTALNYLKLSTPPAELPTLDIPALRSLKLPFSRSARQILAFIAPLNQLETLQIRRIATHSRSVDDKTGEKHFLTLLNHKFDTQFRHSLKHFVFVNMHYHDIDKLQFNRLEALTHLSITQNANYLSVTVASLEAIAKLEHLEEFELKLGNQATEACKDLAWWTALSSIKSLMSFSFWNANKIGEFDNDDAKVLFEGLQMMLSAPHSRLQILQLSNSSFIDDAVVHEIAEHAHLLHTLSFYGAALTEKCLEELGRMPALTSVELIACNELHTTSGLKKLISQLPKLRSLSFRLPSASTFQAEKPPTIDDDAWLCLTDLQCLTSLHLSGYGQLSDKVVNGWCEAAAEGIRKRQIADEQSLKRFTGFEHDSNPVNISAAASASALSSSADASFGTSSSSSSIVHHAPPPGVPWQEVRFSGWMLTYEHGMQLLKCLPQLQLLSVHLLETSNGSFKSPTTFSPRLVFAGGDYLQRQIASYLSTPHVFR